MPSRARSKIVAVSLALAGAAALPMGVAAGQELEPAEQHGDWFTQCEVPPADADPAAPRRCLAFQNLVSGEQSLLQFVVSKPPEQADPAAVLLMPLGISLEPGVIIRIDGGPPSTLPIQRCIPVGCRTQFPLNDTSLQTLLQGREATVSYYDSNLDPVVLPISLDGFAAAYAALP